MVDTKKLRNTGALAAFFTAIGIIGTSVFNNWDHIFGSNSQGGQSISMKGGHDVTNTGDIANAGNVNGNNIQNNKGTVNIGKGSEFYKSNGLSVHMPLALHRKPIVSLTTVNKSERQISHIEIYLFEGPNAAPEKLLVKSPEVSIGPNQGQHWFLNVPNAPQTLTLCASYESNISGRFITAIVPAKKNVGSARESDDRYLSTSNWNVFYSNLPGDCVMKGRIEPIATPDFLG